MATLKEKYLKHIQKSDLLFVSQGVASRMMSLPVCPKCERPALRDTRRGDPREFDLWENPGHRYITCPVCGYHGPYTHSVDYHIENHVINS